MNRYKTSTRIAGIVVAAAASVGVASPSLANDQAVSSKGVNPAYPNCVSLQGDAQAACQKAAALEASHSKSTSGAAAAMPTTGAAPKFPKPLAATGGVEKGNTKQAVQGSAPKYPMENDANGKPMTAAEAAAFKANNIAVKGSAPKYPGRPKATKTGAMKADQKVQGAKAAGTAPKYPALKTPTGTAQPRVETDNSVKATGVAPKFPQKKPTE